VFKIFKRLNLNNINCNDFYTFSATGLRGIELKNINLRCTWIYTSIFYYSHCWWMQLFAGCIITV